MKKYFLALGLVAFLMTSCCDSTENAENKECCKDKKEQCEKHHECDHHGEMPPMMCPEMMEQIDTMIGALANWENLDEAQRADLIAMAKAHVEKTAAMKAEMEKCGKDKPDCCKNGKHEGCQGNHEGCKHEEGKKCEGNHEGCQHQHENCEQNQDK